MKSTDVSSYYRSLDPIYEFRDEGKGDMNELETHMIQMNDTMSAVELILSNAQLIGLIFNLGGLFHLFWW